MERGPPLRGDVPEFSLYGPGVGPEAGKMSDAFRAQRLDFSEPHVLRNEAEYAAAVNEVDELLERNPPAESTEYERLRFLAVLIEAYDEEHFPLGESSTPQEVVAFMLEQQGKTRADLAPLLGGRSRVSDFFSGKRRLSVPQMVRLRQALKIPADLLVQEPPLPKSRSTAPSRSGQRRKVGDGRG